MRHSVPMSYYSHVYICCRVRCNVHCKIFRLGDMGIHGGKHFHSLEYCIPGSVLVAVLTKRLAGGRPSSNQWWSVFAFSFWIKPHTTVSHVCREWNCIQITHVMHMNVKWDYTLVYICYHSATRSYYKSLWDKPAYTGVNTFVLSNAVYIDQH